MVHTLTTIFQNTLANYGTKMFSGGKQLIKLRKKKNEKKKSEMKMEKTENCNENCSGFFYMFHKHSYLKRCVVCFKLTIKKNS